MRIAQIKQHWRKTFLILSFFTFALLFGWLYSRQSFFLLSDIQFTKDIDPELKREIYAISMPYMGQGLIGANLSALHKKLLSLSKIDSLSLRRKWPSTLIVDIHERTPVGIVFYQEKAWLVDKEGRLTKTIKKPQALPLLRVEGESNFSELVSSHKLNDLSKLSLELAKIQKIQGNHLDPSMIDVVSWDETRGMYVKSYGLNLEIDLGVQNFDAAWTRADAAYGFLLSKGKQASHLDAAYQNRVVARLQNFTDGLNLKELVRRKKRFSAAVN